MSWEHTQQIKPPKARREITRLDIFLIVFAACIFAHIVNDIAVYLYIRHILIEIGNAISSTTAEWGL